MYTKSVNLALRGARNPADLKLVKGFLGNLALHRVYLSRCDKCIKETYIRGIYSLPIILSFQNRIL